MPKLRHLLPTIEFFGDIYRQNSMSTDKYYSICQQFSELTWKVVSIPHRIYVCMFVLFSIFGLMEYLLFDQSVAIVHIYAPGVHKLSPIFAGVLMLINLFDILLVLILVPPIDLLFFAMFTNVAMIVTIMKKQMEEMTDVLRKYKKPESVDRIEMKRRLLEFVAIHHKYNE